MAELTRLSDYDDDDSRYKITFVGFVVVILIEESKRRGCAGSRGTIGLKYSHRSALLLLQPALFCHAGMRRWGTCNESTAPPSQAEN